MSKKVKEPKKKPTKLQKWFNFMHRIHHVVIRPFFPFRKLGHTELFDDRAYIIVGNHRSVLDVVPAAVSMSKPVHFMAKIELFQKGMSKWFTKKCECIPVNRDGNDVKAVMLAMKYLKNGETVCIFPEGTRNKTEDVFLPFKSGAAALSIKTRTPILPIVHVKKLKPFRMTYFYYGEPFELSEYYGKKLTEKEIAEADEKLRAHLFAMHEELAETLKDKKKLKAMRKKSKNASHSG